MSIFQLNGVLLAGGLSSRFGKPKAFAVYKGKFFYQRILEVMDPYMDVITIVTNEDIYPKFSGGNGYYVIKDEKQFKGLGPLAGIYSAMKKINADWYFVSACDMPNLSTQFIASMLQIDKGGAEIIIPNINGNIHPLAGLYNRNVFNKIECALQNGNYKLKRLLDSCDTLYVNEGELNIDADVFRNINDQNEYQIFLKENEN